MKLWWSILFTLLMSSLAMAQEERVIFSAPGGFYEESFTITLNCFYNNHYIRYTTNGDTPTSTSTLYQEPLVLTNALCSTSDIYQIQVVFDDSMYYPEHIKRCIVIRAAVFDEQGHCLSSVVTNSYFISELGCDTRNLPVLSIAADSLALFDYDTGIMIPGSHFNPGNPNWTGNFYEEGIAWERPVNVEFYEVEDNSGINQMAGLRTHGGTGRRGQQKGLKIYAREEYGTKRFKHQFFKNQPIDSYKHLVLKSFTDYWFSYGITDDICNHIAAGLNMETLTSRPVSLYINGEYWGIYYIREKPDAHYLEDHFGFDDKDYNIVSNWYGFQVDGDTTGFVELMRWIADEDFSIQENYELLCQRIDVDCFIDYYCLELFIANNDWPANNMRCYQRKNGPWRWIFFDGDDCLAKMNFDVFDNATSTLGTGWPTDRRSTLLFRKLLENTTFYERFFARFSQLIRTKFVYDTTKVFFDQAAALVRDEVPQQAERFGRPSSLNNWERNINTIDQFLANRVENMNERILQFMHIEDTAVQSLKVYPNPTTDYIFIECEVEKQGIIELRVYDLLGQKVIDTLVTIKPGTTKYYLPLSLRSGVYVFELGLERRKVIVQ